MEEIPPAHSPLPQKVIMIALLLLVQEVFSVPHTNKESKKQCIFFQPSASIAQAEAKPRVFLTPCTFRSESTWFLFLFFLMQSIISLKKATEGRYTEFCLRFLIAATRINLLNTCGNPYVGLSGSWETGRLKYCFNYNLFLILILLKWKW